MKKNVAVVNGVADPNPALNIFNSIKLEKLTTYVKC